MPLEGKYLCGNACVVAYNRKKVEEYEEWLEMLPEKGEAELGHGPRNDQGPDRRSPWRVGRGGSGP